MNRLSYLIIMLGAIFILSLAACSRGAEFYPVEAQIETGDASPAPTTASEQTPTETPVSLEEGKYSNEELMVSFEYPSSWQYLEGEAGSEHYGGDNGFIRISTLASGGMTLDELAEAEIEHALQPFGSNPVTQPMQITGIDARKITPSSDQPKVEPVDPAWGEVIVAFPRPVMVNGFLADFLILQADLEHLEAIAATLKFNQQALKQSLYPADSDTPAAGICASYAEPVVPVVISAETMPDPRCIQVQPGQVLNLLNRAGIEVPLNFGNYKLSLQPGKELLLNVPVTRYLAPGVHHLELDVTGSAPEIWLVAPSDSSLPAQEVGR